MSNAYDLLKKFIEDANRKTEGRYNLTLGYIGNVWDCGQVDDRAWMIFCNAKPEKNGFGNYRTEELPDFSKRMEKDGMHKLGRHFDIPELMDKELLKKEAAHLRHQEKKKATSINDIPLPPEYGRKP